MQAIRVMFSVRMLSSFIFVSSTYPAANIGLCRYPNLKNVKELVYKKGYARIEKKAVPLTDNNIIEQVL